MNTEKHEISQQVEWEEFDYDFVVIPLRVVNEEEEGEE